MSHSVNFRNYFPRINQIPFRKLFLKFEPNWTTFYYIQNSCYLWLFTKLKLRQILSSINFFLFQTNDFLMIWNLPLVKRQKSWQMEKWCYFWALIYFCHKRFFNGFHSEKKTKIGGISDFLNTLRCLKIDDWIWRCFALIAF